MDKREAMKILKDFHDKSALFSVRTALDIVFPELKKSEDERIKKMLIEFFGKGAECNGSTNGISDKDILAWLEKQNHDGKKWIYEDVYLKEKEQLFQDGIDEVLENPQKYGLKKQGEQNYEFHGIAEPRPAKGTLKELVDKIEKQDNKQGNNEQILANSAKTCKDGQKSVWHNEDEEPQKGRLILLIMQSGTPIVAKIIVPNHTFNHGERWAYIDDLLEKQGEQEFADKVEPKFGIGDYLVNDYCKGKVIALTDDAYLLDTGQGMPFSCEHNIHLWTINDAKDGDVLSSYSCYVLFKEIDGLNIKCHCTYQYVNHEFFHIDTLHNKNAFHPATKEESAALLTKLHEEGWSWNPETKELSQAKETEKSDAWSEEDEKIYQSIIDDTVQENQLDDKQINWLLSLKQRML